MDVDAAARGRSKTTGYLSANPALYILVLSLVILGTAALKTGSESIFACDGKGYIQDRYLAYCHALGYGDYEHGAFWFGLEPSATTFAARANVLFLGDSRMQHAFSTRATSEWFSSVAARFYLLGFGYSENSSFAAELLERLRPQASVYVINVDRFFDNRETVPAQAVMKDDAATRFRYEAKRVWQMVHRPVCAHLPGICGNHYVVFRSREDGMYYASGLNGTVGKPVSYDGLSAEEGAQNDIAIAQAFLSRLRVRRDCVILTLVPTVATKATSAARFAAGLGLKFIAPELGNLQTFDGSHLDHASAERWSAAFLEAATPRIRNCLASAAGLHHS